jgi:hypothetical protein
MASDIERRVKTLEAAVGSALGISLANYDEEAIVAKREAEMKAAEEEEAARKKAEADRVARVEAEQKVAADKKAEHEKAVQAAMSKKADKKDG